MSAGEYSPRAKLTVIAVEFVCLLGMLSLLMPDVHSQVRPKRVLVLYWDNKDYPGNIKFDESFKAELRAERLENIEYYPEYFEYSRFPQENHALSFRDYLREKYAGRPIDVVVATADAPLNFLLSNRAELFPDSPIVFVANNPPDSQTLATGPGATGLNYKSFSRETLELALRLRPQTTQVFVISGSPQRDRRFETAARQEFSALENRVAITYLTDLPLNELIAKTKSLPPDSVILFIWQQALNEQGRLLESYEVVGQISAESSAPIFGMGTILLGSGIVGGYLQGPEMNGARIAELVAQILNGTRAKDIPVENARKVPMFDWRELRRWGISEKNLPQGSVVNYREYTFWEQYKWRIVGVLSLVALQTILILVLLIERRRRRLASESLDRLNAELEERIAARTAALDAKTRELETFAYSVAHDLKAPLRGIEGYSRLLLEDHATDLKQEGREFLTTIRTSTEEMDQLISDLLDYSRLERRELKTDRIELKALVNAVVEQKEREVTGRQIAVAVNVNGGFVHGDVNGLTQALKNYLDNAIKFTKDVATPRIEIGSDETSESCRVWVRDNGVGFDMKYKDRIFDIFQRLNRSEEYPGTGIGLAIVRKAMERMGGKAWGESEPGQGATFYLEIPK